MINYDFVVGWQPREGCRARCNLVNLWRKYGMDRVTIGKKA
jgi:hypothetical protein